MKRYDYIDADDHNILDNVIKAKTDSINKAILEKNKDLIKNRYNSYSSYIQQLEFNDSDKEALQSLYINETKPLTDLKIDLKKYISKCPYCQIAPGNTIEHILPKEIYPEYSIYSKNLIPCCSQCNSYKGTRTVDEYGIPFTLNFYENNVPIEELIEFKIKDENKIEFKLINNSNSHFNNHIKTLNLLERYANYCNDEFTNRITEIEESCRLFNKDMKFNKNFITKGQRKKIFEEEYEKCKKVYGYNYWKGLIYKAFSDDNILDKYYGINKNIQKIDELYSKNEEETVIINKFEILGKTPRKIEREEYITKNRKIEFKIERIDEFNYDEVYFKILNTGSEADSAMKVRGEIIRANNGHSHIETTCYSGKHIIECFLIRNNVCVATGKTTININ